MTSAARLDLHASEMQISGQTVRVSGRKQRLTLWSIQPACNIKCTYCYGSFSGGAYKDLLGHAGTPFKTAERVIDTLRSEGFDEVHLSGGEPLLNNDFWKIVSHIKKSGIKCRVTTNGTILNGAARSGFLENSIDVLMISLDTIQESYGDLVRERHAAVKKNLEWLLEKKTTEELRTKIGLYCVVSKINLDGVAELAEWFQAAGGDAISLQPIYLPEDHPEHETLSLTALDVSRVDKLKSITQRYRVTESTNPDWFWDAWRKMLLSSQPEHQANQCFAGDNFVYIDPSSKVYRCPAYAITSQEGAIASDAAICTNRSSKRLNCTHLSFDCLCLWKLAN